MNIETRDYAPHVVRVGWNEGCNRVAMVVKFGLHHLRGNATPYFAITADGTENGRESFGGCCHDLILQHLPDLADVVALHLADSEGAPMHAEANGWYWLGGMIGGAGSKYHAGTGSSAKTPTQCAAVLAEHLRITEAEARRVAGRCNTVGKRDGWKIARQEFAGYVDAQRPRWKREADALIRKYGLGVYGCGARCTPAELLARLGAGEVAA